MSNNFQKPAINLTEELAKTVEEAAEKFSRPAKEKMNLREFMIRILPTIKNLREVKRANWSEIAEFLGTQIGHKYSENRIRVIYISITKKAPKKPKNTPATLPSKEEPPTKTPTPPAVQEEIPEPAKKYRSPPAMIIQGTKDPFN